MAVSQLSKVPGTASPSFIELPRDHGAHSDVPFEMWWVTSSLRSGERRFGAQTMLIRFGAQRFNVTTCVTDLGSGEAHPHSVYHDLDRVTIAEGGLDLRSPTASFSGSSDERMRVTAAVGDSAGLDLELRPRSPVLRNCGTASFPLAGATTWQYSVPALETTGTVTIDGTTFTVEGDSWYDRQWFDREPTDLPGLRFTWLGICLDNGDNLSLWDLTVADPHGGTWATIAHPDGSHSITPVVPVAQDAAGLWASESGNEYPARWTVKIPRFGAMLEVTQTRLHEVPGGSFYTGVLDITGSYQGESVSGYGFCDLVGWNPV